MDYKQELITTIHDFGCNLDALVTRLTRFSEESPTAVLIPALYEELKRPALTKIRDHLATCKFVKTVIVCVNAPTVTDYAKTLQFFQTLPQTTLIIWENGPRITQLLTDVRERGLDLLKYKGKGLAVWLGLGVASLSADAIALHDADIITYDCSYPLKLLYPLLDKEFGIAFNKAYYTRLGNYPQSFHGRVVRLFIAPLLNVLKDVFGEKDYLSYLSAYRYPLAGEFALTSDLALHTRIPANWGLEIGLLAEVYRSMPSKRIAQVDLGIFDHKHQPLGDDVNSGLQKMCRDIFRSILRTLTETEQVVITKEHIHALRVKFRREAQNFTRKYFIDARFNDLFYDRHQEEIAIECFEQVISHAGEQYFNDPVGAQIPDWTRALAVMPDLRERLIYCVQQDVAHVTAQVLASTLTPKRVNPLHLESSGLPAETIGLKNGAEIPISR